MIAMRAAHYSVICSTCKKAERQTRAIGQWRQQTWWVVVPIWFLRKKQLFRWRKLRWFERNNWKRYNSFSISEMLWMMKCSFHGLLLRMLTKEIFLFVGVVCGVNKIEQNFPLQSKPVLLVFRILSSTCIIEANLKDGYCLIRVKISKH